MPCEGRTETLKSIKKERYKTEKQKMMEQLDQKDSTQRAKCFIIGALLEKSESEQENIIANLEKLADEAQKVKVLTQD